MGLQCAHLPNMDSFPQQFTVQSEEVGGFDLLVEVRKSWRLT